jgi:hypothetical protein
VYIAFVDDSGSDSRSAYQVAGAVYGKVKDFAAFEVNLAAFVIENLIPENQLEFFEEFKASDLYTGNNAFKDISEERRHGAIKEFLTQVADCNLSVAYGAVPKQRLLGSIYGAANLIDVAFRICLLGIQGWMEKNASDERCLLISDDYGNKEIKKSIREAFRRLRVRFRPPQYAWGNLELFHDAIAFCDSRDSVGVQAADMCSYFIGRHLQQDTDSEWCYDLFKTRIPYGGVVEIANTVRNAATGEVIELPIALS